MRNALWIAALGLALSAPAFAQNSSTTDSPPAPRASESEPEPAGSLPPGAATATQPRAGDAIGRTTTTPPATTAPAGPAAPAR